LHHADAGQKPGGKAEALAPQTLAGFAPMVQMTRNASLIIVVRPIMAAAAFPGGRTRWKAGPQAELPAPLNARSSLGCKSNVNHTDMFLRN
jgi:hypothetical protein